MITCRELAEFLGAHVAKELSPDQAAEFERHLAACPNCVAYVQNYERTVALGREAFEDSEACAQGVPEDLLRAILSARRK